MNDEYDPVAPDDAQRREHPEPAERAYPVPNAVLAGVAALLLWCVGYIALTQRDDPPSHGDRRSPETLAVAAAAGAGKPDGAQLYAAQCAACHQASGAGLPGVFPPLDGSEWVAGPPGRLAGIVLHGVNGPLTVKGTVFNGQMPAFGGKLGDAELAALLTHVRARFGNNASPLAAADVAAARAATADRKGPWNGDVELGALQ